LQISTIDKKSAIGSSFDFAGKPQLSRFFAAVLIFSTLIAGLMLLPPRPASTSYLASAIDKVKLLDTVPSPRLILIGGSNLAFGIDSAYLQNRLQMPVINMGVHAAFGLRYMLNQARPYIRSGDIVLIVPEYEHFIDQLNGNDELLQLLWLHPAAASAIGAEHAETLVRAIPGLIKRKFKFWEKYGVRMEGANPIYMRSSFNQYGDVVSHLTKDAESSRVPIKREIFGSAVDSNTIIILNDFVRLCTTRGARLFYGFPPLPDTIYYQPINRSVIQRIENDIYKKTDLVVLGKPIEFVYPEKSFFDARYHLMPDARRIRTSHMAELLLHLPDQRISPVP
jgi:hypothetical protein